MKLIFKDNFFNAGETDIWNEAGEPCGALDLKSAFGSSVDVYDKERRRVCSGRFPAFSGKWIVTGANGRELGVLRHRFAFFSKKYTYEAAGRGAYDIESPAFSKEYDIRDERGALAARFEKISGWFASGAYALDNGSPDLDSYELVCVIMGMHEIQKRHQSAANSANT